MQSHLLVGPAPVNGFSSSLIFNGSNPSISASPFNGKRPHPYNHLRKPRKRLAPPPSSSSSSSSSFTSATGINGERNHYSVLGVARNASFADIKRAYRLLARKYHPDVSKDSRAGVVFKSIRRAYEVLSNEVTRNQYDRALTFQEDIGRSYKGKWNYSPEFEDGIRIKRWAEVKRKMREERFRKWYRVSEEYSSFHDERDDEAAEENLHQERGSFIEVLKSAFITLCLLQTFGSLFSLTFSSLTALLDKKLDAGYKIGYVIAWVLGGRGGILLTLCLSFASWVFGKTSSSIVVVVVVAMWIGSNLARYAPLPQGALLTLLYMSIKLQVDLN
ncbi:dnaJ homolog subfamily B member 14-like [Durio zibethinus]|uniref:DnaJ homolog subfamily B member 14-like n=1 Tax=Durio zibethinus TaxID=66656 RepID=A0A6P5WUG5_DURZI|nr:dnaJ homolog subfamily B member 14-like [Durio zibethinus]XP_022719297.1 dnaJ homolog subfamily B member 14-like [Durio zibethinus]